MGTEKVPAPAPKGVDVGVNTEEIAELVEEENMEGVSSDAMVRVVLAAHTGGRRRTPPAAIGGGGGGPRSHGGGNEGAGAMAKAVVVHGILTNWWVRGLLLSGWG